MSASDRLLRVCLVLMAAVFSVSAVCVVAEPPSGLNCYETYQPNLGWLGTFPDICVKGDCLKSCKMVERHTFSGVGNPPIPVLETYEFWCECDGVPYCHATAVWSRPLWPAIGPWAYTHTPCSGDCGFDECFDLPGSGPGGTYKPGDRLCGCT